MNQTINPFEPPAGGLSLYIHVPFCERKCPYCAFESNVPSDGETDLWLEMLSKELKWWEKRIGKPSLATCYIGGGTPTVINGPQWIRLAEIIDRHFTFMQDAEVTVEANPNSLKADHLLFWRDWRVTRVSIGAQSFDDAELQQLGRLHSASQAYEAVSASLASGFSVSADFMFGLPGQTFRNWARTLSQAVRSGIDHISLYQLALEPGTLWESMPEEDLSDGYLPYRWAQWYMPRKGYAQYEIANFAKEGHESRHNINYWEEGEYLGIGPGASGCLKGWRYKNVSGISSYSKMLNRGNGVIVSGERLCKEKRASEAAILALRMTKGIDREEFSGKYGIMEEQKIIEKLRWFPEDLYIISEKNISLTLKGMRVANRIWSELV
ncbi:MAG: radical SAM family heme chaperone HemW [Synergistaceae bacterium]|nr:radical SAM family heme chaperone HemW [Synergistaceae bacterium]